MKLLNTYVLIGLIAASPLLFANEEDHEAHSFVQLSWVRENPQNENVTPSGLGILARADITEHWFLRGEYEDLADGNVDERAAELALSYVINPHGKTAIHVAAIYEVVRETEPGLSSTQYGRGAEVGFHAGLSGAITLHGEMALISGNGQETLGAEIGLFYRINEHFGANIEYLFDEDRNSATELGFRYSF